MHSEWSAAALSAWGKTARDGENAVLPLVRHLEDTAAMAAELWDHWLPEAVKIEIGRDLPGGSLDARALFTFLAGVHDIGKLTPAFAVKITYSRGYQWVLDQMSRHDLVIPPRRSSDPLPPHGLLSQLILRRWLRHIESPSGARRRPWQLDSFAGPVGAHHGVPPTSLQITRVQQDRDIAPTEAWRQAQDEVLGEMARRTGVLGRLPEILDHPLALQGQIVLAGAIVVADWLASDQVRFPFDDDESSDQRAARVLAGWELPSPWRPQAPTHEPDQHLEARFPGLAAHGIRPLQAAATQAAAEMSRPGLLIIEAGMGEGKTEAALLAAERLAARFGLGGVFFALPTQATSDGIFPRLRDWVQTLGMPVTSMFLAHGKAALNDDYRKLAARGRVVGVGEPEDASETNAVVTSWLRGRRRGVLANFVAGTIDQVLFAALSARFVQLRQAGLAGKVVVIDEVHAADAFMRVYLERALAWFAAHRTPVILLSATLPPAIRQSLVSAYADDEEVSGLTGDAYPRLTIVDDSVRVRPVEPTAGRRARLVVRATEDWLGEVCRAVEAGGCVAVVHNTVGRAQDSYERLVELLGGGRVQLLHSRFLSTARADRERRLRELLGPPLADGSSPHRPRGFVVVGTQVLEQSLDIDVDLMVSDLAPVDLILQRAGRIHRHDRRTGSRPDSLAEATLLLTGYRSGLEGPPVLDENSARIYGKASLLRALAALEPHLAGQPIGIPTDIPRLVALAYSPGQPCPVGWEDAWAVAESSHATKLARQRADAQPFLLPMPTAQSSMVGLLDSRGSEPDDDGSARSGARVRDTDESIEVVVVRSVGGQLKPMPEAGLPAETILPTELASPDDEVARRLAACTLRLPSSMTRIWPDSSGTPAIDRVIRDLERQGDHLHGWSQSPWLKGELVLIFDDQNTAVVDGWELTYDADRGLRHTKPKG